MNEELAKAYLEVLESEMDINENTEITKVSLADTLDCVTTMLEAYNDIIDSFMEEDEDDVTTEGANLDSRKKFKELKKEVKNLMKQYKAAMKVNDFAKARQYADGIISAGNRIAKEIKNIEGDAFSVIVGNAIDTLKWYATVILVATAIGLSIGGIAALLKIVTKAKLITSVSASLVSGGIAGVVMSIKQKEKEIEDLAREIHGQLTSKDSKQTADAMNKYRNSLIAAAEKIAKDAEVLKRAIDEKEKKYNEEKSKETDAAKKEIKESADELFKQMKLVLYESCSKGEITVEEREAQIDEVKNIIYAKQIIAEESLNADDHATKEEVFSDVKKALYERCGAGEFNEDIREELIHRAYNQIFMVEEMDAGTTAASAAGTAKPNANAEKEIDKSMNDAKKEMEKTSNDNNAEKEIDKNLGNPVVGDAPTKESTEDTEDLDALVASWDKTYAESSSDKGEETSVTK